MGYEIEKAKPVQPQMQQQVQVIRLLWGDV
jgi:hypothetical protein